MKDYSNTERGRRTLCFLYFSMVLVGITDALWIYMDPFEYELLNIASITGSIVAVICTIFLVILGKPLSVIQKIGICGIILGVSLSLVRCINFVLALRAPDTSAFMTLYVTLQMIVSLLLVYFSFSYLRGNVREGLRMALFFSFSGIVMVYYMLFEVINHHITASFFMKNYWQVLVVLIIYVAFILAIFSPGAHVNLPKARMKSTIDDLLAHSTTLPQSTILRADIIALRNALEHPGDWESSKDGSPFREYSVRIGAKKKAAKTLLFRWNPDNGSIRVIVTNLMVSESIQSTRFEFISMVPIGGTGLDDCDMIRIYGKDGFFADILVEKTAVSYDSVVDRFFMDVDRRKNNLVNSIKKKIWQ